jgi:glycopeptide antibiotics resistance protein
MLLSTKLKLIWIIVFLILIAASLSKNTGVAHGYGIDLIFHISIYALLSFIPILLFRKRIIAFMATIAIAPISFLFEVLHSMVNGYDFEHLDAFCNNIGIVIGIIAASIIRLKKHYESKNQEPDCQKK